MPSSWSKTPLVAVAHTVRQSETLHLLLTQACSFYRAACSFDCPSAAMDTLLTNWEVALAANLSRRVAYVGGGTPESWRCFRWPGPRVWSSASVHRSGPCALSNAHDDQWGSSVRVSDLWRSDRRASDDVDPSAKAVGNRCFYLGRAMTRVWCCCTSGLFGPKGLELGSSILLHGPFIGRSTHRVSAGALLLVYSYY